MRRIFSLLFFAFVLVVGCAKQDRPFGFTKEQWASFSKEKRAVLEEQYKRHTHEGIHRFDHLPEGPFGEVVVHLSGGSAMLWPDNKQMSFEPVHFKLYLGDCKDVTLKNADNATVLCVCYKNGTLVFDPDRDDAAYSKGGLIVHQNGLWRFGVVHPSVTSKGFAALTNVQLQIKGGFDG